jgi:hypothetical protein
MAIQRGNTASVLGTIAPQATLNEVHELADHGDKRIRPAFLITLMS